LELRNAAAGTLTAGTCFGHVNQFKSSCGAEFHDQRKTLLKEIVMVFSSQLAIGKEDRFRASSKRAEIPRWKLLLKTSFKLHHARALRESSREKADHISPSAWGLADQLFRVVFGWNRDAEDIRSAFHPGKTGTRRKPTRPRKRRVAAAEAER